MALRLMHLGELRSQPLVVIAPARPVVALPEVVFIPAIHAEIMRNIHRIVNILTALFAVFDAPFTATAKAING